VFVMELREWIIQQNGTVLGFAREWDITYQTLKKIVEKRSEPRCGLAKYISQRTGGGVSLMELRGWEAQPVIPTVQTTQAPNIAQPARQVYAPPQPVVQAAPLTAPPARRGRRAGAAAGATPVTLPPVPMQAPSAPAPQRRQRRTAQAGA